MACGLFGLSPRVSLLQRLVHLTAQRRLRSVRASVFTWPQVDKRFPFQENFFLKDQEIPPKAVIELLGPLVTPGRLQSLDKVLLRRLPCSKEVEYQHAHQSDRLLLAGALKSSLW